MHSDLCKEHFEKLKKAWYERLEASGFQDAEQDEEKLKSWSSMSFRIRYNETLYAAKEDYYRLAGHFANDYPFASEFERKIWALHAEGRSVATILIELGKQGIRTYKTPIHKIINRLKKEMIAKC